MNTPKVFESEYRFCLILWENEPIKSTELAKLSLVTKEEVQAAEVDEVVEKTFDGNVPQFLAAFTRGRKLSKSEIDEIQKMIDEFKE